MSYLARFVRLYHRFNHFARLRRIRFIDP